MMVVVVVVVMVNARSGCDYVVFGSVYEVVSGCCGS